MIINHYYKKNLDKLEGLLKDRAFNKKIFQIFFLKELTPNQQN